LCYLYIPYESDWLYAGVEEGNVYIVSNKNLELSGCTIYWDKAVES
uniref:Uncharacterized protein n=1 Tax=Amphimedon queenslandica TaxID=400682 RepID=A0A1X7SK38_AMPQE